MKVCNFLKQWRCTLFQVEPMRVYKLELLETEKKGGFEGC